MSPVSKIKVRWLYDGVWKGKKRAAGCVEILPTTVVTFLESGGLVTTDISHGTGMYVKRKMRNGLTHDKHRSAVKPKRVPATRPRSKPKPKPKPPTKPAPRQMKKGEKSARRRKTLLYKYKRRRYMIGYGVWNKQDMVGWMIDGVAEWVPTAKHVRFAFDHCTDDSEMMFDMCAGKLLGSSKVITKDSGPHVKDEIGIHNALLRYFMEETDYDVLVIPQDDQRFSGPVVPRLEPILHHLGDKVGVVGARLGYEFGLKDGISSQWGGGVDRANLPVGGWAECTYLNTGPVIYPRSTVEKVGYLDEQFEHWFIWEDYCARCKYDHGLTNVVVDIDMRHVHFGRRTGSSYYTDKSSTRDRKRMHEKWGRLGW